MKQLLLPLLLGFLLAGCRGYVIRAEGPRPGTMVGTSHNILFTSSNDQIVLCSENNNTVDCEDVQVQSPLH